MTEAQFVALSPLILVGLASLVVMLAASFKRSNGLALGLTLAGFAASLVSLAWAAKVAPVQVTPLILIDRLALFYLGLVFLTGAAVALLGHGYFEKRAGYRDEFYMLLLMATLGAGVLVATTHFAALFIGLELLTISLYALVGYTRTEPRSLEAGLKYLVLATVSTSFLLFGVALLYAELGTMEFGKMVDLIRQGGHRETLVNGAIALVGIGIGFKLALVPLHMWTPDVYEGAPAPVTAFVATVSKGAMTAVLLRLYLLVGGAIPDSVMTLLSAIAILSMFVGNLLALLQDNVKRILAYSSIAHLGYLLVAFIAGGNFAPEAVTYYLIAYMATSLGTFGMVSVISGGEREAEELRDYAGLLWRRPFEAGVFAAMLMSLAGIPLTAGFIGKFYLLAAGVDMGAWVLLGSVVINSALGLFYYLRIVASMYAAETSAKPGAAAREVALLGSATLAAIALCLIWLGVFPAGLISLIRSAVLGA